MSATDEWLGTALPTKQAPTASATDAWLGGGQEQGVQTPAKTAVAQQASPSIWDQFTRQLGLTARAGATGATGLPVMVGDALNSGINAGIRGVNNLTGASIPQLSMPSAAVQAALNGAGLPQPANGTERVVQDAASAMAGVAPSVGAGKLLARAASPVAQAVGNTLQSLPGMQILGAAGSGTGQGIAQEAGAGPAGQLVGSVLGGLAGAAAPSIGLATARGVAAIPANIRGVVQPLTNPQAYVGNQLAQTLGADAPQVAASIRGAQQFVPGSLPTTAQAGATPTLVATEKALANISPEFKMSLAQRQADNNAARWSVLSDVAQTPEALAAAQAARAQAVEPLYDAAHRATANVGPAFMRYAQIPEMQEAMAAANANAALDAAVGRGVAPVWPTPDNRSINGAALDYTSRALDGMINKAKIAGDNTRAASLQALQGKLENWTQTYIPGVKQASDAYAGLSTPINTMEAGQQIAGNLGTRAMGANGVADIQLMPYRSALTQALNGQKFGIDPQALSSLQGIGQDLQRATISNSLRSPGSDTAYNISAAGWLPRQIYGQNFEGAGNAARGIAALGALAHGNPTLAAGVMLGGKKLGAMAGDRLNAQLAQLMLNPQQLLPYLDAATSNGVQQALANGARGNVNQGLLGAFVAPRSNP